MSERTECVKCHRPIHAEARICPYCNWWQSETPPQQPEAPPPVAHVPPPQQAERRKLYGVIAFAALLVLAFVIGSLIHGFEPSDIKAAQDEIKASRSGTQPAVTDTKPLPPPPKANVDLVPMNNDGSLSTTSTEAPLTTAPAGPLATSSSDATAMTSQQYAAATQPRPAQTPQPVDPRSLTGTVYDQSSGAPAPAPRRERHQMAQSRSVQTQPVPEYQPVPRLSERGTARLALTIDDSGRVRDVEVLRSAGGDMGRLIDAVQSWRFRPAMNDGQPVPARFTVDINFND